MSDNNRDSSFFNTIKEKVDLEDYLTKHLNVELVPGGVGMMAALCPFHEEDTPSFIMNDESERPWKTWHCFGACGEGGTVLDAVMKAEPTVTDVFEAAEYLNEMYDLGLAANSEAYKNFRKTVEETRAHAEKAQEEMANPESRVAKQARQYLHNRGYTDEIIEYFGLGIDTSQTAAGRLAIPIHDRAGQPVSVANRALFDKFACRACGVDVTAKEMLKRRYQADKAKSKGEAAPFEDWKACPHCNAPSKDAKVAWLIDQTPKYLFLRDFDKRRYLYNEHGARGPMLKDADGETIGLFLAEGYPDVWAGVQAGHQAMCAYSGAVLSDEQAKEAIELAQQSKAQNKDKERQKPIILVPDFDETGQGRLNSGSGVGANIRKLHAVDPTVEVQVIHSIDKLTYKAGTEEKGCKDLGEVLQHFGAETVDEVLRNNRWPAGEWRIRRVVEATNPKTGESFYSKVKEMELIGEILRSVQTRESLDHLIPELAAHWKIREEQARNFFYAHLSSSDQASAQHLFKDIEQAQLESAEFLADANVIPLGFEELDKCFPGGGVRPGQLLMMLGKSGTGKAQPLDAKVLTADGWKLMGEITVGDEVVNPEGGTARVVGVFPQGERDIYRVTFSDGSSTECDLDHLWKVRDSNRHWKVRELRDIVDNVDIQRSPHHIPLLRAAPDLDRGRDRPLPAYLLGTLIGDAGFGNSNVIFSCAEKELLTSVAELLPVGVVPRKIVGNNVDYGLTQVRGSGVNSLTTALKELGLYGHLSHEKFIPEAYLWAPADERLEMLQGLMDTDGSVSAAAGSETSVSVEFGSSSPQLAADVVFLVQSLGGTARTRIKSTFYRNRRGKKVRCRPCHRVRISMPLAINPFRLQRKAARFSRQVPPTRRMLAIDYVGRKPAQCIALDSSNELYVTDDFIVTHNTMLGSQMLANMADRDVNCLFLSLEQGAGSFYPRLACQALDMPVAEVEEFIKGDAPELEKVRELYKNMLLVDNVPTETTEAVSMTPGKVQSIIQEANLTHFEGKPVDVVIIDHLGILEVGSEAPSDIMKSETAAPGWIMRELFKVCKATRVFMIVLQQLPKQVPAGVPFAMDAGWGGSAQTNFCDYIIQIWRPEQAEGLDDTARLEVEGQYKIALGKNRFGPGALGHYFFDKTTLRILPPLRITQPKTANLDGGDDEIMFFSPEGEMPTDDKNAVVQQSSSEAGATAASLQALEDATPNPVPRDNQALLDSLGAVEDDAFDPFGDAGIGDDVTDF